MAEGESFWVEANVLVRSRKSISSTQLEGHCDIKEYFEDKSRSGGGKILCDLIFVNEKEFIIPFIHVDDALEVIHRGPHKVSANGNEHCLDASECPNGYYAKYVVGIKTVKGEEGLESFALVNTEALINAGNGDHERSQFKLAIKGESNKDSESKSDDDQPTQFVTSQEDRKSCEEKEIQEVEERKMEQKAKQGSQNSEVLKEQKNGEMKHNGTKETEKQVLEEKQNKQKQQQGDMNVQEKQALEEKLDKVERKLSENQAQEDWEKKKNQEEGNIEANVLINSQESISRSQLEGHCAIRKYFEDKTISGGGKILLNLIYVNDKEFIIPFIHVDDAVEVIDRRYHRILINGNEYSIEASMCSNAHYAKYVTNNELAGEQENWIEEQQKRQENEKEEKQEIKMQEQEDTIASERQEEQKNTSRRQQQTGTVESIATDQNDKDEKCAGKDEHRTSKAEKFSRDAKSKSQKKKEKQKKKMEEEQKKEKQERERKSSEELDITVEENQKRKELQEVNKGKHMEKELEGVQKQQEKIKKAEMEETLRREKQMTEDAETSRKQSEQEELEKQKQLDIEKQQKDEPAENDRRKLTQLAEASSLNQSISNERKKIKNEIKTNQRKTVERPEETSDLLIEQRKRKQQLHKSEQRVEQKTQNEATKKKGNVKQHKEQNVDMKEQRVDFQTHRSEADNNLGGNVDEGISASEESDDNGSYHSVDDDDSHQSYDNENSDNSKDYKDDSQDKGKVESDENDSVEVENNETPPRNNNPPKPSPRQTKPKKSLDSREIPEDITRKADRKHKDCFKCDAENKAVKEPSHKKNIESESNREKAEKSRVKNRNIGKNITEKVLSGSRGAAKYPEDTDECVSPTEQHQHAELRSSKSRSVRDMEGGGRKKADRKHENCDSEPKIYPSRKSHAPKGEIVETEVFEPLDLNEDNFDGRVFLPEIPADVADWLVLYLENSKQGGGDVEKLEFDENRKQAYATFVDPAVARGFLKRGFVQVKNQLVQIIEVPRAAPEAEEDSVDLNSIVVEGLDEVDLDLVEMYFENKRRSSGGGVKKIEQIPGTSRVLITFEDSQVADQVLKRTHELKGMSLSVARPPRRTSLLNEGSQALDTADSSISRSTSIRVCGVRDGVGEDFVKMFFENKRRSGGGAVANCQASGDGFVITFEDPDVVDSVMARHTEKPLELSNSILKISIIPPVASLPGMAASWLIDDGSTSCAMKVSGLPVSEDNNLELLKMFFENRKRSGGGGKVEVVPKEDENFAVVVFENTENVGRVFQQYRADPFTLNHSRLTLEILRPLPVPALPPGDLCPRSLLCRGIYSGTTSAEIKKFFAERLNYKVNRLIFCLKPDIVLIQFVIDFDYCSVIKAARSFPLGPVMVCLERVPMPRSVQVYNYGNLTEQALVLCLEDHRGVAAEVSHVEERTEEGCMIVHFEDGSVIPRLLENPQTIEGNRLHFNIYHECLGLIPPEVNSSEPICLLPSDVPLKFDPDILEYISHNKEELDQLQKDLSVEHCTIEFPQQKGDGKVTLVCQLKKNSPDLNKLSKNWAERCTEKTKSFVSLFYSGETGVLQDFWEMLKEKLSKEMKSGRRMCLRITINDASHSVSYIGRKIDCNDLHHKIARFIAEIEDHMEMQKRTVTERIDCLKIHQLQLLKSIKFFDEDATATAGGLTITFDGLFPVLTGQSSEAMAKKIKMFEILNRIVSESYQPPQHTIRMLNDENFVKYLQESLQKLSIKVVWEMGSNGITVYGLTQAEVDSAVKIVKEEFIYREIPLNEQNKLALTHPAWGERKVEFKNHTTLILEEGEASLKVFATSNIIEDVIERIHCFIKDFTIHHKVISFKRGICKILSNYKLVEIDAICKSLASYFVKVLPKEKGFEIHGTQFGLPPAEKKLRELANGVIIQEKEIDRPGMATYFLSKRGKDHVETIQSKHRVYIENSADTSGNSDDESVNQVLEVSSGYSRSVDGNSLVAQAVLDRGITVSIMAGDITTCRVDAIVNAANADLKHIGGVAKSIADAGGDVIQRECDDFVRKSGRVLPGSLYVSQAGLLPCKAVFHVVGPIWQGGWSNEENILFQAVTSVLEEMVKQGYSSVALPAISTGIYGFPLNKACKIILEAIRDFVNKIVSHSLVAEICIIDNSGAANDMFSREMQRLFSDKIVQPGVFRGASGGAAGGRSRAGAGGERRDWEEEDEEYDFKKMSRSKSDLGGASYGRGTREKQSFERKSDQAADERNVQTSLSQTLSHTVGSSNILKTPNGLTIELVKGSIADEQSDVILNTTNQNLHLSNGAVSSTLLAAAGAGLETEAKQKAPQGLAPNKILATSGHGLLCKEVYHCNCLQWDNGAGKSEASLRKSIELALLQAAQAGYSSISFPAIGTGNLKIPHDLVAQWMLEEVENYSSKNPATNLSKIRIVVYHADHKTIQAFESEIKNPKRSAGGLGGSNAMRELRTLKKSTSGATVGNIAGGAGGGLQKGSMGWAIKLGGLTVEVSQGDITREKSDAIVNSSNENLDLSLGKVSNSILNRGGRVIQKECSEIVANGDIQDGLAVSSAGNLDCKYIFHLVSKHGDRDWKSRIERCLQRAATMKLSSISFPLLGTGNIGKSASIMAGIMLDAISKFSKSPGTLRFVRITIYEEDMVKEFADAMHNKTEGASGFFGKAREMFSTLKSYMGGSVDPSMEIHDLPTSRHCSFETKVCFRFFALRREDIDSAVKDVENHCSETVTDKVIEGDYSDVIKKLSSEQIAVILNMENIYPVSIKVEQGRLNRIRIRGEMEFLLIIQENLYKIFREAEKAERDEEERKFAEMVAKQVQWMYEDGITFTDYPQEINILIEKAYIKKEKSVEWQENDGNFRLDFEKEREYTVGGKSGGIKVKRVSSGDATLPSCWDTMKSGEKTKRVKLTAGCQEWKDVEQFARTTSGATMNNIFSIERIQNPTLYQQYMVKKNQMEKIAKPAFPSERKLWHGTAVDTLESIEHGGFNRSYCGKNAVVYGRGVYFASQFSYSASNSYSIPDPNTGYKYIYQTLVLTGEYVQGNQAFIVPPSRAGASSTADCYDSVVDNVSNPSIFVIFNDVQAYPEYLITFN